MTQFHDDNIQFPRLLCEIMATQRNLDIPALSQAMNLSIDEVNQIFDKANTVLKKAMQDTTELNTLYYFDQKPVVIYSDKRYQGKKTALLTLMLDLIQHNSFDEPHGTEEDKEEIVLIVTEDSVNDVLEFIMKRLKLKSPEQVNDYVIGQGFSIKVIYTASDVVELVNHLGNFSSPSQRNSLRHFFIDVGIVNNIKEYLTKLSDICENSYDTLIYTSVSNNLTDEHIPPVTLLKTYMEDSELKVLSLIDSGVDKLELKTTLDIKLAV